MFQIDEGGRKMISRSIMSAAVLTALASAPAVAQMVVYPAKGQSAAQQQKDETECYAWAKGQTGYDPAQATPYAAPPPPPQHEGERARGAARGAAGGAVIGAIAGDAGKGAAIGATAGTVAGGSRQRRKQEDHAQAAGQQQQAAAQQQQQFQKAYAACFEGRGYTVN
jgi:hypothetical protein